MARQTVSDREKAKQIILAIIQESDGGVFCGTTRLYKAFYHAHLFFWKEHRGALSFYPVVHMPKGPGIDQSRELIHELASAGKIGVTQRPSGDYTEDVYKVKGRLTLNLTEAELDAVRKALSVVEGKGSLRVSAESHGPSFYVTKDGEEQNIYLDTLSELEFEEMQARQARIHTLVSKVFE